MKRDELIKASVKYALEGKRHYGSEQHRSSIQWLADKLVEADNAQERNEAVEAIVAIGNLSALQQKLAKAGAIDRNKRGEEAKNLFADLAEFVG